MHPELERRMLAEHLRQLQELAGPARAPSAGARAPRNRPRVRVGLVLMRAGARLAKPALPAKPWPRQALMGR